MSDVVVKLNWDGDLKFTGVNAGDIKTVLDGNKQSGPTPTELLLEALGACSAIDVVAILEKMHTPATKLEVVLDASRRPEPPRYFTDVRMRFDVWGDGLNPERLKRAINLSVGKYCSVYHSLRNDLKLQPEYRIHETGAEPSGKYVPIDTAPPTGELH
jgi:putative redox protein